MADLKGYEITIPLSEYKQLVTSDATKVYEVTKANEDKFEREAEIARLTKLITKYRDKYGELPKEEE